MCPYERCNTMTTVITEANSLKAINNKISNIAKNAGKLNDLIHDTAVSIMVHARDFGNCMPAAQLLDALPKSHRRGLLIKWFSAHSPITIVKMAKSDRMKAHLSGDKADRVWELDAAMATPFFAMSDTDREPEVPLDYEKFHGNVINFMTRMNKKIEAMEGNDKVRATEELNKLKAAIGA